MYPKKTEWIADELNRAVREFKNMLDARDALKTDEPEKKMVAMRSVQTTFGTKIRSLPVEEPIPTQRRGGVCCLADGTCDDSVDQATCEGEGGTWHSGANCVEGLCVSECVCPDDVPASLEIDGSDYHGFNFSICSNGSCSWCGYDQAEPLDDRAKVQIILGTEDIGPPFGSCYWIYSLNDGIVAGYKTYDGGNPIGDYFMLDLVTLVGTVIGEGSGDCIPC